MDFLRILEILWVTAKCEQLIKTLCISFNTLVHQFYSFFDFPFLAHPLQVSNGSYCSNRSLQRLTCLLRAPAIRVLVLASVLGLWVPLILAVPLIRALICGVRIPLPRVSPVLRITLFTSLSHPLPLVRVILTLIGISTATKIRSLIRITSSGISLIGLSLITVLTGARPLSLGAPLGARTVRGPLARVHLLMVLV